MKRIVLFFVLAQICAACLDPHGENYVKLPEPIASELTLDIANIDANDTIFIDARTLITYEINGFPLYVNELKVELNEIPLFAWINSEKVFEINPLNYPSGYYKMTIEVVGDGNNGSLAERLGVEHIHVSGEFNVVIDSTPPEPIEIVQLDSTNGKLTVHWNKSQKKNFVSYTLHKYCFDEYGYSRTCKEMQISDANVVSWTDDEYVGGKVRYSVDLTTDIHTVYGIPREYWWKPRFVVDINAGWATLHWSKPLYYSNATKVIVESWPLMPTEFSLNDTTYVPPDQLISGFSYSLKLTIVSKNEYLSAKFTDEYYVGQRYFFPVFRPYAYNPNVKLYYGFVDGRTIIMDESMNVTYPDYQVFYPQLSANSKYFIGLIDNNLYTIDPETLAGDLLFATGETYVQSPTVANNGLIGFSCYSGYKVIDPSDGSVRYFKSSSLEPVRLSPSGNYLVSFRSIYKYDGNTFVYQGDLPIEFNPYQEFKFAPNDNLVASASESNESATIREYDIASRTALYSIALELGYYIQDMQFNTTGNKVLFTQGGVYRMLDREKKQVSSVPLLGGSYAVLLNGKVFSPSGYYTHVIDFDYIDIP